MSILQTIGLKLLGTEALATIKKEVVEITRKSVLAEEAGKSIGERVGYTKLNDYVRAVNAQPAYRDLILRTALGHLVGPANVDALVSSAVEAEKSGEGFMKKKSAVLKDAKLYTTSKSEAQAAVELAVQLTK